MEDSRDLAKVYVQVTPARWFILHRTVVYFTPDVGLFYTGHDDVFYTGPCATGDSLTLGIRVSISNSPIGSILILEAQ